MYCSTKVGCVLQRDNNQLLWKFEPVDFDTSRRLFYAPSFQFLTLDDEIIGTSSTLNPMKNISLQNADRDGHYADVIADVLFIFVIASCLYRRGESCVNSVRHLVSGQKCGEKCQQDLPYYHLVVDTTIQISWMHWQTAVSAPSSS